MSLESGAKAGPYLIVAPLGAGGMGEVYRARDTRLDREVAIKVLAAGFSNDAERLRRFEQEARATGALNHPNVLAIYDIGTHDNAPYIVSELLEGKTLRDRLSDSTIPVRKAVEYGVQIARGLAAAHEKGIVHRDLKPENVFVTNEGRIKILDFGLAKLTETSAVAPDARTLASATDPGVVLGTVGYMSPEQVRGKGVDHRSDIFNLGAILYEMLSGKRAFQAESGVETMNAILKDDPPDLASNTTNLSPALNRLIRRCLEKNPDERFRSAHDVAFTLDALSDSSIAIAPNAPPKETVGKRRPVVAGLVALVLLAAAFFIGRRSGPASDSRNGVSSTTFKQLTFRRGTVRSARFSPDGKTIIYGAAWDGEPLRIFLTRLETPESTRLPMPDADILSISSAGELAVSLGRKFNVWTSSGTLARAPLVGGSSREILEGVSAADWSTDGKEMAIVRRVDGHDRIEYPVGKVLSETIGYFSHLRISPKGDRIAFLDHPYYGDNRGTVAVVDLTGKKTTLSPEMPGVEGLAWKPDALEVWYTGDSATGTTGRTSLYSADLAGNQRLILGAPVDLTLYDVFPGGRALLTAGKIGSEVFGSGPGETKERNLGALSFTNVSDISRNGELIALTDSSTSGLNYDVYIRRTDGSAPVRIGEGVSWGFSPDGRFVIATTFTPPSISILPTGAGEPKRFTTELSQYQAAQFLSDDRIVIVGNATGRPVRTYSMNLKDGKLQPITPEGVPSRLSATGFGIAILVAPDGNQIILPEGDALVRYSISGEKNGPVPGAGPGDLPLRWAEDGKRIFVGVTSTSGLRIFSLDLSTGRRQFFREIGPADPAGIIGGVNGVITPDGKAYAYNALRLMSDLYLVEGLR
jgi:eukaryotic-like serine/threonine-protein kinase